jgi:phospholipid/cholesterol/gamma-HCH transport system substrate-binding protein
VNKNPPSIPRLITMVAFAASCFAILLYLWLTFGGSVPLSAKGYRIDVAFPEATTLAQEADVRISGVKVGEVKTKQLDEKGNATRVTLEIEPKYAPLPMDTRAILRQKTLLGETYVELTPGSQSAPRIHDGGTLPRGQVAQTVELDEIFRSFDKPTRAAFRTWLDQQGQALGPNGEKLNEALGNLAPFAENANVLLKILDDQKADVQTLVRDTGQVFDALSARDDELAQLVTNSNRVFSTTADRNSQLADTFRILPTFIDEGRQTTDALTAYAVDTNPLITQLRPAARELSPTLIEAKTLAPNLKSLFKNLGPLIDASKKGIPATQDFLKQTKPLLAQVDPFLRQLNPVLQGLFVYRQELTAFFSLDAAATQASDRPAGSSGPIHYLRTANPVNPEILATYPHRLPTNRSNPYVSPGGYNDHPMKVFGTYTCTTGTVPPLAPPGTPVPTIPPVTLPGGISLPIDPVGTVNDISDELRGLINQFVYQNGNPAAPPCIQQDNTAAKLLGQTGLYPHLEAAPERK